MGPGAAGGGGGLGMRSLGPNSLIFTHLSGSFDQIICYMLAPCLGGWRPPRAWILDPPLMAVIISFQTFVKKQFNFKIKKKVMPVCTKFRTYPDLPGPSERYCVAFYKLMQPIAVNWTAILMSRGSFTLCNLLWLRLWFFLSQYATQWKYLHYATVTTSRTPMLPIINKNKSQSQLEKNAQCEWALRSWLE